jgi:hypothetical protein
MSSWWDGFENHLAWRDILISLDKVYEAAWLCLFPYTLRVRLTPLKRKGTRCACTTISKSTFRGQSFLDLGRIRPMNPRWTGGSVISHVFSVERGKLGRRCKKVWCQTPEFRPHTKSAHVPNSWAISSLFLRTKSRLGVSVLPPTSKSHVAGLISTSGAVWYRRVELFDIDEWSCLISTSGAVWSDIKLGGRRAYIGSVFMLVGCHKYKKEGGELREMSNLPACAPGMYLQPPDAQCAITVCQCRFWMKILLVSVGM